MDGGNVLGGDGPEGRSSLQRGRDGQGGLGRFMRLERGEVFQGGLESGAVLSSCSAVFWIEAALNARVMITTCALLMAMLPKSNETCCVLATSPQPAW